MLHTRPWHLGPGAHAAIGLAAFLAAVGFVRALAGALVGAYPLYYVVLTPVVGFLLYFVIFFGLQLVRAVRYNDQTGSLDASLWFVWLVCGAFVAFVVGALLRAQKVVADDEVRVGLLAAGAWALAVAATWLASKLLSRRDA